MEHEAKSYRTYNKLGERDEYGEATRTLDHVSKHQQHTHRRRHHPPLIYTDYRGSRNILEADMEYFTRTFERGVRLLLGATVDAGGTREDAPPRGENSPHESETRQKETGQYRARVQMRQGRDEMANEAAGGCRPRI